MNENVEAGLKQGMLEVECVIRKADGTIKSTEKVTKPVSYRMDQSGETQIVELQEE